MANETVPIGQIDYKILVTLLSNGSAINISSAGTKKIVVTKPDGTVIDGAASFETDGTDGKLYYKTVSGDLNMAGWYSFRAYIVLGNFQGHSSRGRFLVEVL